MSLENVLDEIEAKGRQDISKILRDGEIESEKILQEAKAKLKEFEEQRTRDTNDRIKQLKVQELSKAELDAKKNILNMQRELLEKLRDQILKRLKQLPQETNQQYLKTLIARARTEFVNGRIYCNAADEKFVRSSSKFEFGGTIDCIGGVLVETTDGSINLDLTYENILDEAWRDMIKDISKLLFKAHE